MTHDDDDDDDDDTMCVCTYTSVRRRNSSGPVSGRAGRTASL